MRQEIGSQGLHTEPIEKRELREGDSAKIGLPSNPARDAISLSGWRQTKTLDRRAAGMALLRDYPHSIFNDNNESLAGERPAPLNRWQPGFGVIVDLGEKGNTQKLGMVVKATDDRFVLLQPV